MCFAGHVCNCLQENVGLVSWVALSLGGQTVVRCEKTGYLFINDRRNRSRLTGNVLWMPFSKPFVFLSNVYMNSWIDETHLRQITVDVVLGEAEPHDMVQTSADTTADIFLRNDAFVDWTRLAMEIPDDFPCGVDIWRSASGAWVDYHRLEVLLSDVQ
jgi:hypothetical protein